MENGDDEAAWLVGGGNDGAHVVIMIPVDFPLLVVSGLDALVADDATVAGDDMRWEMDAATVAIGLVIGDRDIDDGRVMKESAEEEEAGTGRTGASCGSVLILDTASIPGKGFCEGMTGGTWDMALAKMCSVGTL